MLNDGATFDLATRIRTKRGVPLGDVFSFLSGLYFRGKLAYAQRFANPPPRLGEGAWVITTNRGLVPAEKRITIDGLRAMGCGDIHLEDKNYTEPLERDLLRLKQRCGDCQFILLGSVATGKYVDLLLKHLGQRLLFPLTFIGRGDMSRGGLMLRHARSGIELDYAPVHGAIRNGKRPPKLGAPAT